MDRDKFIKVLKMTTSSHEGEALAAIRKVNDMISAANLQWDDLIINPNVKAQTSDDPWNDPNTPRGGTVPDWKIAVNKLRSSNITFTVWEERFLESLYHSSWNDLTPKQEAALQRTWVKYKKYVV